MSFVKLVHCGLFCFFLLLLIGLPSIANGSLDGRSVLYLVLDTVEGCPGTGTGMPWPGKTVSLNRLLQWFVAVLNGKHWESSTTEKERFQHWRRFFEKQYIFEPKTISRYYRLIVKIEYPNLVFWGTENPRASAEEAREAHKDAFNQVAKLGIYAKGRQG